MVSKKRRIILAVIIAIVLVLIIAIVAIIVSAKSNNLDDATHAVTINENVVFYKKPKTENVKIYKTLELGTEVYVLREFEDDDGVAWSQVSIDGTKGYVLSSDIGSYKKSDSDYGLMVDVSHFNQTYNFETAEEFGVFLVTNNIDYVYIRAGGRGYGEEGNFYYDECYTMWAEECEYLGIPFGFYFLDEALDNEEIEEEVEFIVEFLQENNYEYNVLPVAIDVEKHDGEGRADDIWDTRSYLVSRLLKKLEKEDIETIVYSNALVASEYLSSLDTQFWIAYYPTLNGEIPDYWYSDLDQEGAENEKLMKKTIAWQFTDTGVDGVIDENVDLSLVIENSFE